MSETNQKEEVNICQHILNSNGFNNIDLINRIKKKTVHRSSNVGNTDDDNENMITKKWASFTYFGTEMLSITLSSLSLTALQSKADPGLFN
jgi:hypothetical protein